MWVWDSRQFCWQGRVVLWDVEEEMKEIYGNLPIIPLRLLLKEDVIPQTDPNAAS